jgi:hypothetical protein
MLVLTTQQHASAYACCVVRKGIARDHNACCNVIIGVGVRRTSTAKFVANDSLGL